VGRGRCFRVGLYDIGKEGLNCGLQDHILGQHGTERSEGLVMWNMSEEKSIPTSSQRGTSATYLLWEENEYIGVWRGGGSGPSHRSRGIRRGRWGLLAQVGVGKTGGD